MKKFLINISILLALGITFSSCSDFLDRESSDYSSTGFYKSEAAIMSGAAGVYNCLYMELAYALPFNVTMDHLTAMAMERNENTTVGAGGALNPDNATVQSFWQKLYTLTARANTVISG